MFALSTSVTREPLSPRWQHREQKLLLEDLSRTAGRDSETHQKTNIAALVLLVLVVALRGPTSL